MDTVNIELGVNGAPLIYLNRHSSSMCLFYHQDRSNLHTQIFFPPICSAQFVGISCLKYLKCYVHIYLCNVIDGVSELKVKCGYIRVTRNDCKGIF